MEYLRPTGTLPWSDRRLSCGVRCRPAADQPRCEVRKLRHVPQSDAIRHTSVAACEIARATHVGRVPNLNCRAWASRAAAILWVALIIGPGACTKSPTLRASVDGSFESPAQLCTGTIGTPKTNGDACGCDGDCQSGLCVDGVCCSTACSETCKSCNTKSSPGICAFVAPGDSPGDPGVCPNSDKSTCGLDGTCNGSGGCRTYVAGTVCKAGTCLGAAVDGAEICDGHGLCRPGPATVCAPFSCDPAASTCFASCAIDGDCVSGAKCVNGSCGPKVGGAACVSDTDCASGFCADGLCCNVACRGACVSCNQTGREGTCWPVDSGAKDPRGLCQDQGARVCGQTGTCDGFGGCVLYAAETVCSAPSCTTSDHLTTAGTCDGLGSCRPPGVQVCAPYHCSGGACIARCTSDADCVSGRACQNGSCGPKPNGQTCTGSGECESNFCVDGVCCAEACTGACRSCALPSALGQCAAIPAGAADPRAVCVDQGATTCGTDGKCDGAKACRRYQAGTLCAAEHCESNIYKPAATCSATGSCVPADARACAPFACNGARCFTACTADANCTTGHVCIQNSCGLKLNGAFCADGSECISGTCAQGVCCAGACSGSCRSCALLGAMGVCSNTPDGQPDPSGLCSDKGAANCGTNGKCQGGACQSYAQGTPCKGAACLAGTTTFTPASRCNGISACVTPGPISCAPFLCGAGACKSICSADADCAPPSVCSGGSCGLKSSGATCGGGTECASGICAQGACCKTACAGTCTSCALAGSEGTCAPVYSGGRDPASRCNDLGAASCGNDGFCNGAGGCRLYAAGTECAAPSCPIATTTATLARSCDGVGTCRPAATQSCVPYTCNGSTCQAACATNADCSAGTVCNNGSCGKKRLGQICGAGGECDSGNCVDSVCCSAPSCGNCASCNVKGSAGACAALPAATVEPHGGCAPAPPCGFDGTCDGNGACRFAPLGKTCGTASCTGSTLTPAGACDGAGTCRQMATSCAPFTCGVNACRSNCSSDADCVMGFTCQAAVCTNLKPNGTTCAGNAECTNAHCTDGYCCGTASCGICRSCGIAGSVGSCAPVAAGSADPHQVCGDQGAPSCGTTGLCDGAGACAVYADGTPCAPTKCQGDTVKGGSACRMGRCVPGTMVSCTPYRCDPTANACKTTCASDADCAMKNKCTPMADGGTAMCGP
jgi:hypothetical protein